MIVVCSGPGIGPDPRDDWPVCLGNDLPAWSRGQGVVPAGYTDPDFNAAIRAYFRRLTGWKTPHVAWLDATLSLPDLARCAAEHIRQQISQHSIKGAT